MKRTFFHSKIHRAKITSTSLDYMGSLTIDRDLLDAANINIHEQIQVLNINNGERFVTYAIEGERGSGTIQVNGAAARLCSKNDLLIIITYCDLESQEEIKNLKTTVVHVDDNNKII